LPHPNFECCGDKGDQEMQNRNLKPTDPNCDVLNQQNPDSLVAASVLRIMSGLMEQGFYGSVELKFEAGKLVTLKKTETIKPAELFRDTRGSYERSQSR
jgi:hypothetical protein